MFVEVQGVPDLHLLSTVSLLCMNLQVALYSLLFLHYIADGNEPNLLSDEAICS